MKTKNFIILIIICLSISTQIFAQYPWPVTPMHQSHELTGTFCEFRDTGDSDHFHNGVDVPKPDGSPVYAIANGTVTQIIRGGSNAYVRVGRYCYLHINPSPYLNVGDQVTKEQTVLGTILAGQGHIHFIDGYYNSEINAIREGGGLTPYDDPWPPKITSVNFYQNGTDNIFPGNTVSGAVDIVVKVEEKNAPPGSASSRLNNGTYLLGYHILSANGDTVKYRPPNNGVRFKFDLKPNNSYVHNVFFKKYSSTSSHVYIVTNNIAFDSYWDSSRLIPGTYQVMVFTEDTRQNTDTVFVEVEVKEKDIVPPNTPVLKYVRRTPNGFQVAWYPNTEDDLLGYRLYYSRDNTNWNLRLNEQQLPADSVTASFNTSFSSALYFKLTAIDNAAIPNESDPSDVYGIKMQDYPAIDNLLIVDGFDRTVNTGGVWPDPSHSFGFTYGSSVAEFGFAFEICSNDAVIDGAVDLADYWAIIWFVGDEAEANETLSALEQDLIDTYLQNGGRLFISGSNIAWDLDLDSDCYSTTVEDDAFLHNVLKADYQGKISPDQEIRGSDAHWFTGLAFDLNPQIYNIDSLDVIEPELLARACLQYDSTRIAGVAIENNHRVLYFAFPFELIASVEMRNNLMDRILTFLFFINSVEDQKNDEMAVQTLPTKFQLEQNYPNPFSAHTLIKYKVPKQNHVSLHIFNLLGQRIRTIKESSLAAGVYQNTWDGRNDEGHEVPNGVYFYVLQSGDTKMSRKLILMRQ